MQFGYHLTLDLYNCDYNSLSSLEICHEALKEIVTVLNMNALIPPYVFTANSNENSGGKDPGGITGFIIIAESHISLHTFAKRGFVSIDVYSCKEFDLEAAESFFTKKFTPLEVEKHFINRGLNYPDTNIY